MSQLWRCRVKYTHKRSATYAIYWLWTSHRCLHVVWSFLGSTTAMLCSMALHPAPSTSCSGYRTTSQESFIKRQHDHTHTCCWRNCIGCRWSSASLQPGRADVQDMAYVSTGVSQSARQSTQWHSFTAVISCSISRCAVQMHWHWQTIFQLCCNCNLELSASCCHQLWHSICV